MGLCVVAFRAYRVLHLTEPILYHDFGSEVLLSFGARYGVPDLLKRMNEMGTELAASWVGPHPGPYRTEFQLASGIDLDADVVTRQIRPGKDGTTIVYTVQPVASDDVMLALAASFTELTSTGWSPVPADTVPVG